MKLERLKQNTGLPSAGAVNSEACGVDEGALKSQLTQCFSTHIDYSTSTSSFSSEPFLITIFKEEE